jgi:L-amino acid N-acyltransferase YncA
MPAHDVPAETAMPIRTAEPRDIAAITRIYAHAVEHGTASFELEAPDEAEILKRYKTLREGRYPFIVADVDGQVAGYAYAGPYRPRPAYRFAVEDSVYIDPTMRRRGVGRALLQRLLAEAEAEGFRQMIAIIGDSNQTPSIALHQALGFRMVGTFEAVGYKFGRWLDSVMMQKALGKGATSAPL